MSVEIRKSVVWTFSVVHFWKQDDWSQMNWSLEFWIIILRLGLGFLDFRLGTSFGDKKSQILNFQDHVV